MPKRTNARSKLNAAYVQGSLIVAAVVGWIAQSWSIFALTAIILLTGNVIAGEIRPRRRNESAERRAHGPRCPD